MEYTVQSRLDNMPFGARWGCYFTGPINAAEYVSQRQATETEIDLIVGRAFRRRLAFMANYKNDATVRPRIKEAPGWGPGANPEWHYLVDDYQGLVHIVQLTMCTAIDPERFELAVMSVSAGNHYCIRADKSLLINPDPSLMGNITRYIPFTEVL